MGMGIENPVGDASLHKPAFDDENSEWGFVLVQPLGLAVFVVEVLFFKWNKMYMLKSDQLAPPIKRTISLQIKI